MLAMLVELRKPIQNKTTISFGKYIHLLEEASVSGTKQSICQSPTMVQYSLLTIATEALLNGGFSVPETPKEFAFRLITDGSWLRTMVFLSHILKMLDASQR